MGARAAVVGRPASPLAVATLLAGFLFGALVAYQVPLGLGALAALSYGALVFTRFTIGLAVWVFLAFFEALPFVERGVQGAGLLLAFAWLGTLSHNRAAVADFVRRHARLIVTGILLLVWIGVSTAWAARADFGVGFWQWPVVGGVFAIVATSVTAERSLRLVIGAFVLGVLAAVMLGLGGTLGLGLPFSQAGLDAPNAPVADDPGRLAGGLGDPNVMASAVVAAAVLAAGLAAVATRSLERYLLVAAIPLLLVGLVATESRTGIVVMMAAIGAGFAVFRGRRLVLSLVVAMVLSLGSLTLVSVGPPEFVDRLQSVSEDRGTGRLDLWRVAWEMSKDHPVTGVGANNFPDFSARYVNELDSVEAAHFIAESGLVPHNAYLELLAETGLVGLALFVGFVAGCLRASWRAIKLFESLGAQRAAILAQAVLTATGALLVASFFTHSGAIEHLWVLLALGPAMLGIARRPPADVLAIRDPLQSSSDRSGVPAGEASPARPPLTAPGSVARPVR